MGLTAAQRRTIPAPLRGFVHSLRAAHRGLLAHGYIPAPLRGEPALTDIYGIDAVSFAPFFDGPAFSIALRTCCLVITSRSTIGLSGWSAG